MKNTQLDPEINSSRELGLQCINSDKETGSGAVW